MIAILPILGVFTLAGLLYAEYHAEREKSPRLKWIFKPLTSLLFVLTGLLIGGLGTGYANWIMLGLVLGAVGDVLLLIPTQSGFLAGLVAFLGGHIAYVIAFNQLESFTALGLPLILLIGGISAAIFIGLRKYFGALMFPVLAYFAVITLMVWSALAVYGGNFDATLRLLIAVGALCFYASDLAVALDRFVQPRFKNAYWGLPLYYLAQFMLAFSIGAF